MLVIIDFGFSFLCFLEYGGTVLVMYFIDIEFLSKYI